MKLRNSARKTKSQMRMLDRSLNRTKKRMGMDGKKEEVSEDTIDTGYAPMEQKNMLNSYGYLYDALNGEDQVVTSSNFYWDAEKEVYYVKDKRYRQILPDKEVFGWHPYWMGNAWKNYPFELLSTLSYFSYKVDPASGSYSNPEQIKDWRNTALIDSAQIKKTKILLTVSSHGRSNNNQFLSDRGKWSVLIDSVTQLIKDRNADGVDLNFEQLPYLKRERFNLFVKQFREQLDNQINGKKPIISITLPAVDSREIFDVVALQKYADLMVIMGYDYNTGNQIQGAVAPLRSVEGLDISLSNTVSFYLNNGIDPQKTVLALPYYGSMWTGNLDENGEVSSKFERKVTYREIMNLFSSKDITNSNTAPFLDKKSMTNYFNLTYPDNSTKEIWFDDDFTLGKKFDYAISQKLKGIGVWALGYDNGYEELWDVIDDRFASKEKIVTNPITAQSGYAVRFAQFLLKKKDILITAAIFFFFSVVIGFLITLSDWRVRDSIARNQFHRTIFIGLVFIFLTPLIYLVNEMLFLKSSWVYYLVFLFGNLTFYLSSFIKIKAHKKP
jgi:spore germination protein YaaH